MSELTVQFLEENIKQSRKVIEVADSLDRLKSNRDFKRLILEGFFEGEAVRLVQLKADPQFQTEERQKSVIAQIDAIGSLNQYFVAVQQKAQIARRALEADEATREEILNEDNNG